MEKADLLDYKEALKYARIYLAELCIKYKLIPIKLKTDRKNLLKCQEPARFNSLDNTILLNRLFVLSQTLDHKIRHEFRHYWQRENYKKAYNWWLVEYAILYNEMHNTRNIEGRQLSHIYCPLEIDAMEFETNDSGNEEILIAFENEIDCHINLFQRY